MTENKFVMTFLIPIENEKSLEIALRALNKLVPTPEPIVNRDNKIINVTVNLIDSSYKVKFLEYLAEDGLGLGFKALV